MADPEQPIVGKTILQLDPVTGQLDRTKSFMEVHVEGDGLSKQISVEALVLQGQKGVDGTNGKSAFQIAKDAGFPGTEAQWLLSLVGAKGTDGTNGTNGTNGTKGDDGKDGTNGTNGTNGKSAFEIAQAEGFVGDVTTWLASLKGVKGNDGDDGLSAFQVAVAAGYTGTEAEWLDSLYARYSAEDLQILLDSQRWTFHSVLRAKGEQGSFVGNSLWNNFIYLHDKRINGADKDWNLIRPQKDLQKIMEGGFLNDKKIGYFKLTHAPDTIEDEANPDNPMAQYFITDDGYLCVGSEEDHIRIGAGTKFGIVEGGVLTREIDLMKMNAPASINKITAADTVVNPLQFDQYARFTFVGAKTYTFDGNAIYPQDCEYHGRNATAGDLTLVGIAGFTLNAPYGGSLVVPPNGTFTVKIIGPGQADVFGVTNAPA